jgi:hypothetical protein
LTAYEDLIAEAEEACGAAELYRQAEEISEVRSAIYGKICETAATTFEGLAAHIRFLLDDGETEIILAGLNNIQRSVAGRAVETVGVGPR